MRKYSILMAIMTLVAASIPAWCAVLSTVAVPSTRATGYVVTASDWNSDVGGIYSYINNTLAPALNVMTAKGDMYVYTGSALDNLPVGTDGQALVADSAQTLGVKWATLANSTQLTTKGDLITRSASAASRLGIGSDGQVLIADSGEALGMRWGAPSSSLSTGMIIAWSPAAAGTNVIPSGWLLCDGTSSTPNLIGKFIIGTRPSGSTATAAATGYGVKTVDTNNGALTHTHTVSGSSETDISSGTQNINNTAGTSNVAARVHTHDITLSGITSDAASFEPSNYALVYLMKQ